MIYTVDGSAINSREDWRHTLLPAQPQSARVAMFPGVAQRFVMRDVEMPDGVVVTGYLQGVAANLSAAVTALHAAIRVQATRRATRTVHTVVVHGTTFNEMILEQFAPIAAVERFDSGAGQIEMHQMCRWIWIGLV